MEEIRSLSYAGKLSDEMEEAKKVSHFDEIIEGKATMSVSCGGLLTVFCC